jgi:hypothetical protein
VGIEIFLATWVASIDSLSVTHGQSLESRPLGLVLGRFATGKRADGRERLVPDAPIGVRTPAL